VANKLHHNGTTHVQQTETTETHSITCPELCHEVDINGMSDFTGLAFQQRLTTDNSSIVYEDVDTAKSPLNFFCLQRTSDLSSGHFRTFKSWKNICYRQPTMCFLYWNIIRNKSSGKICKHFADYHTDNTQQTCIPSCFKFPPGP